MSVSGIGGASGAPKTTATVHHPKVHVPKANPVATPAVTPAVKNALNKTA